MLSFIVKRLLMTIPTLFLVTLIVFSVMRLVPGDPVIMMMGDIKNPELIEQMRREMGLNEPVIVQYFNWLGRILTLDFGQSVLTGEPVLEAMFERFGVTAQVVLVSVVMTSFLAIFGGTIAAWQQNKRADIFIVTTAVVCMSIPSFWLGIAFIIIFGVTLEWLPTVGFVSPFIDFSEGLQFILMPVAALVIAEVGGVLRMVRSTTIDVLRLDYITHARAKGLSEGAVLFRHALKNTFAPTLTLIGLILGSLLGGAAVIETVFTLPGLGRLLVTSIYARDYPMVQGIMILIATTYVTINLIVDMMYPVFDPRVKL